MSYELRATAGEMQGLGLRPAPARGCNETGRPETGESRLYSAFS
jgi:hypothetical protein